MKRISLLKKTFMFALALPINVAANILTLVIVVFLRAHRRALRLDLFIQNNEKGVVKTKKR